MSRRDIIIIIIIIIIHFAACYWIIFSRFCAIPVIRLMFVVLKY
jgi:hypothetical protein